MLPMMYCAETLVSGKHEELEAIPADIPDPSPSVAEQIKSRETRSELIEAIGQLPRKQAEAVLMRFTQDLSYSDIAAALGCNEATARTHIARARTRLSALVAHLAPHLYKETLR